MDNNFNLI